MTFHRATCGLGEGARKVADGAVAPRNDR